MVYFWVETRKMIPVWYVFREKRRYYVFSPKTLAKKTYLCQIRVILDETRTIRKLSKSTTDDSGLKIRRHCGAGAQKELKVNFLVVDGSIQYPLGKKKVTHTSKSLLISNI